MEIPPLTTFNTKALSKSDNYNNESTHKKLIDALLCSNKLFQSRGVNRDDIDSAVDPIIPMEKLNKKKAQLVQAQTELIELREKLEQKKIESTTNVSIPPFMKRKYQKDFATQNDLVGKDPSSYTESEQTQYQLFVNDKMEVMKQSSIKMIEGDIEDTVKLIESIPNEINRAERVYSQNISSDILVKKLFVVIRSYFSALVILSNFDINTVDNFSNVTSFSDITVLDDVFIINDYPYKLSELELIQTQLCNDIDALVVIASKIYSTESIQKRIVKYTKASQL